jgi:hypothetical protein
MLHAEQRAEHVGVEGGGIRVGGLLRHRARLAFGAGVVDRCVQAAEARDGPIDQFPHVVLVANVGAEEFDFSAECTQLSRELLAGLLVATGDNDAVAFPRERKSRRAPIPVSAPVIKTTGVSITLLLSIELAPGGRRMRTVLMPSDAEDKVLVARYFETL